MYLPYPAGNVGHADMHVLREGAALAGGRATASPFGGWGDFSEGRATARGVGQLVRFPC